MKAGEVVLRYQNVKNIERTDDEDHSKVKRSLQQIENKAYEDVGFLVETRIPSSVPDDVFKDNLESFGFLRSKLVNPLCKKTGGGLLLYYNKSRVEVSEEIIKNDSEQIYVTIQSKEEPRINFSLCAFYMRPYKDIFTYQSQRLVDEWDIRFGNNTPLVGIGDLNLTVSTDINKRITNLVCKAGFGLDVEFEQLIYYNKCLQHNDVLPRTRNIIDVCITKPDFPFDIHCQGTQSLFDLKKEDFHEPLLYTLSLKQN